MNQHDFQEKVLEKFDLFEKRLFIDNGNLSMQSKINRNSRDLKIIAAIGMLLLAIILKNTFGV